MAAPQPGSTQGFMIGSKCTLCPSPQGPLLPVVWISFNYSSLRLTWTWICAKPILITKTLPCINPAAPESTLCALVCGDAAARSEPFPPRLPTSGVVGWAVTEVGRKERGGETMRCKEKQFS